MTDCTEAMWKIKLAFRPGNVDMVVESTATGTAAIDDARYFGNYADENEFPELENLAFPQYLLSSYDLESEAKLDAINERMISDEMSAMQHIDSIIPSLSSQQRMSDQYDSLTLDDRRVSDIELMRAAGSSRYSLSTFGGRQSRLSASQSIFAEDNIPAFDEQEAAEKTLPGDFDIPEFDEQPVIENPDENQEFMEFETTEHVEDANAEKSFEFDAKQDAENMDPLSNIGEEVEAQEEEKQKQKRKKRRVAIDQRIELSDTTIRQRMANLAPTLRRAIDDPFAAHSSRLTSSNVNYSHVSIEDRAVYPVNINGLCPQLEEMLAVTTGKLPFPFPRVDGTARESLQDDFDKRVSVESVEIARGTQLPERDSITDASSRRASYYTDNQDTENFAPPEDDIYQPDADYPMEDQYQMEGQDFPEGPFEEEKSRESLMSLGLSKKDKERTSFESRRRSSVATTHQLSKNSMSSNIAYALENSVNVSFADESILLEQQEQQAFGRREASVKTKSVYNIVNRELQKEVRITNITRMKYE